MNNRKYLPLLVTGAAVLIIILSVSNSIFFTVQAGERAVMFRKFSGGLDKKNIIGPGFNFKAPWNDVYIYDVTENQIEETMDVLDKNGLNINVDITLRFHPMYDSIGEIYETFQRDYVTRLVIPEVRSTVRQAMGRYTAEEIFASKRSEVETSIKTETEEILGAPGNNVVMRALLIRSIKLPDQIRVAIENKLKQEQEALAYQFRLDKEKSEAERKRIAAEGEAAANKIINSSLTKELLKMRGIEATTELSKSPNAKTIVIGSGSDGLPLILGGN
ncbi:MAG: prohibitin family protein [Cyclobacteriaceae bacterium]|uniref:prohibitin family protein n=1 Tax=Nonlabens ulvanivorans TaxID=906888 RepID=UPI00327E4564